MDIVTVLWTAIALHVVACGIAGAIIGEQKGLASGGFFAGLLLGIPGVLAIGFMRRPRLEEPCPACRERVNLAAFVCPWCQCQLRKRKKLTTSCEDD